MKKAPFRHFSNTDHARNSASAVLDSYMNTLTMSEWAKNSAHAAQMNSIDNAFTTGRVYSVDGVDGVDGGRFYTDTNLAGNMFIGTQNSLGGFAGSLQIAGLIAHEGTHYYQYANNIRPQLQLSEYAAHAAQYAVMKGMSSYTLTAQEMQSIDTVYNFAEANDYAAAQSRRNISNVTDNAINADPTNQIFSDPFAIKHLNREYNGNVGQNNRVSDTWDYTSRDTAEYTGADPSSLFGDKNNTFIDSKLLNEDPTILSDEERLTLEREQEQTRSANARQLFLEAEAEIETARKIAEYKKIIKQYQIEPTNRDSLLNRSGTNEAIAKLRETLGVENIGKDNAGYDQAITARNTMIRTICENSEGNRVNIENIEQFRLIAVNPIILYDARGNVIERFQRRNEISNQLDGEITFENGRQFVDKINMLGALGVKFDSLMVNAHGHENTTYSGSGANYYNGLYYGDGPRGAVAGPQAASWNDIRWEGIVNDNFTLFMGSCTGYDDAEAGIKIIKDNNKDISGLTAYGRTYIGNWAGATAQPYIDRIWKNLAEPMGLVRYEQDVNGNIVRGATITHPANRFLFDADGNRARTNYSSFVATAIQSAPEYIRELNRQLSRRND